MLEQLTEADLEKEHVILNESCLLIGPAEAMSNGIARAVAAGIAIGRKEVVAEKRRSKSKGGG
jgi:hypothetical protein